MSSQSNNRQDSVASGDHVFVSYSREDRDYVTKLAGWLEGHGVIVWFDHDIDYGTKWEAEIQDKQGDKHKRRQIADVPNRCPLSVIGLSPDRDGRNEGQNQSVRRKEDHA